MGKIGLLRLQKSSVKLWIASTQMMVVTISTQVINQPEIVGGLGRVRGSLGLNSAMMGTIVCKHFWHW